MAELMEGGTTADAGVSEGDRHGQRHLGAAIAVGCLLVVILFAAVFPHLWYGLHEFSDAHVGLAAETGIVHGKLPYRDFSFEYPPLALPLMLAPGHAAAAASHLGAYERWYAFEMFLITLVTVVAVALTAALLWRSTGKTWGAVVAFALMVAAAGALVENRYDIAVALTVAVVVPLCARRALLAAGVVTGLAFALKLTPVVLLPLVVIIAADRRQASRAVLAAAGVAFAAYLPFLVLTPHGVLDSFTYHLRRPLQLESLPATPLLVRQLIAGGMSVHFGYGSENLFGPGAKVLATLGGLLTVAAVLAVCALLWGCRATLRERPEKIPLAVLALLLASITFGKVFSPQYVLWLLPAAALVMIDDLVLGLLTLCTVAATQVEFPALYPSLVRLEPAGIAAVACRNALLLTTFVVAVRRVDRLRCGAGEAAGGLARRAVQA